MKLASEFLKAKYNITFADNDDFQIGARDLRELVTDFADSFGQPSVAYADAHYIATVAGAQPVIAVAGALRFFNLSVDGRDLVRDLDYTDDGRGNLRIDARDPVQVDQVVQYAYLTSALQAIPGYTDAQIDALLATKQDAAPVLAVVNGVETPFATLHDAIASGPSAIYLRTDVELSTSTGLYFGALYGNGHTVLITSGGRLRLLRSAKIFNVYIDAQVNGYIDVIGSGSANGGVPPPEECLEVSDGGISAPIRFAAVTAYQGLVLRGNSFASNLAAGGGPVYLYDLAYTSQPLPAGFTLYDNRFEPIMLGSGTVLKFDRDYEYPAINSGTFTVDVAGARFGKVVFAELTVGTTQPQLNSAIFELEGGIYQKNKRLGYAFRVTASGKIRYVITLLP